MSKNKKIAKGPTLVERLKAAKQFIKIPCASPHSAHSYATQVRKAVAQLDDEFDVTVVRETSTVVCRRK